MNDEELRKLATKRLKAKADYARYLWVWLGVSLLVTAIWFVTSPGGYFWPAWAIGGMGVGAFFMGLDTYGPGRRIITEDAIDSEIRKLTKGSKPDAS